MASTGAARIGGWLVVVTCCMEGEYGFNGSSVKITPRHNITNCYGKRREGLAKFVCFCHTAREHVGWPVEAANAERSAARRTNVGGALADRGRLAVVMW
ncbi:hypothetical protein ACN22W_35615 [Burkholderia theae]|uniref:hypothetical protein n=1 Tax=Burkholderia theae TaxID=3143496 RepID=UPI003AFA4336